MTGDPQWDHLTRMNGWRRKAWAGIPQVYCSPASLFDEPLSPTPLRLACALVTFNLTLNRHGADWRLR